MGWGSKWAEGARRECVWQGTPDTLCLSTVLPWASSMSFLFLAFWMSLLRQRSTQAAATREWSRCSWETGQKSSCPKLPTFWANPPSQPTSFSLGSQGQNWALPSPFHFLPTPTNISRMTLWYGPQAEAHCQLLPWGQPLVVCSIKLFWTKPMRDRKRKLG